MKQPKRLDGKKKLITLTGKMEADIREFCRGKGIESESELIRQAIANYIYTDHQDETLKLQGLRHLREQITELRDMLDITFKYLRLMHINTIGYHPELDPGIAEAAYRSAVTRHDKFFDVFQNSLKNDPPFFERLLHKYFSEEHDGQN